MRITRFFVVGLLALSSELCSGQNITYWPFCWDNTYPKSYSLNFKTEPPTLDTGAKIKTRGASTVMCDSSGQFLFCARTDSTFDAFQNPTPNGYAFPDIDAPRWPRQVLAVPKINDRHRSYVFYSGTGEVRSDINGLKKRKLTYRIFNAKLNGGLGDFEPTAPVMISHTHVFCLNAVQHANGTDVWLIMRGDNGVYLVSLITEDSISRAKPYYFNEPKKGYDFKFKSSNSGSKLVSTVQYHDTVTWSNVYYLDFNLSTGQITNHRLIKKYESARPRQPEIDDICFSPNDSMLYLSFSDAFESNNPRMRHGVVQFDFFGDTNLSRPYLVTPNTGCPDGFFQSIRLGPNGKIYCGGGPICGPSTNETKNRFIHTIHHPNRSGKDCGFEYRAMHIDRVTRFNNRFTFIAFPNFYSPHKTVGFAYSRECKGEIKFTNTSDTTKFREFQIYFGDGSSSDLISSHNFALAPLSHRYQDSGQYLVKIKAVSSTGYYQWWSDTITVESWQMSPVAKFVVEDTLGCEWVGFKCINQTTLRNNLKTVFRWEFGDSTAQTQNGYKDAFHIYKKEGAYTIRLIVSNAHCVDTFELEKEVKILDAPRPGFNINDSVGCYPFNLRIERKYQSDPIDSAYIYWGNESRTKGENTFSNTYFTKGKYVVKHVLFGPSGCVTVDSIQIKVLPGFEPGYVSNVDLVSFSIPIVERNKQNNRVRYSSQTPYLNWTPHSSSIGTTIFRNEDNIGSVGPGIDSFQDIQSQVLLNSKCTPYSYSIKELNHCNELSKSGGNETLVCLDARNAGESHLLRWNIGRSDSGNMFDIFQWRDESVWDRLGRVSNDKYEVHNYLDLAELEVCYLLERTLSDSVKAISNLQCLPHPANLYIPTALTPNQDDVNESWGIYMKGVSDFNLVLYNRWGNIVMKASSIEELDRASYLPEEVYFFTITGSLSTGDELLKKGTLTILRK